MNWALVLVQSRAARLSWALRHEQGWSNSEFEIARLLFSRRTVRRFNPEAIHESMEVGFLTPRISTIYVSQPFLRPSGSHTCSFARRFALRFLRLLLQGRLP